MRSIRYLPLVLIIACVPVGIILGLTHAFGGGLLFGIGLLGSAIGIYDLSQRNHAVLKNYPLIARLRFLLEGIRPEIRQYFLDSDNDEVPCSREQRVLAYRRAKDIEGLRPYHLMIRINSREVRSAASQYGWLEPGGLLTGDITHPAFAKFWGMARPHTFACAV